MKAKLYFSVVVACIIAISACKKIDRLDGNNKPALPHAASSHTDVYAAGYLFKNPSYNYPYSFNAHTPVYWKNGVLYTLPVSSSSGGYATGIALQNSDVLVAGTEADSVTQTFSAVYWRNGTETLLARNATANSIFVCNSGNVFIAGSIGNQACYWDNGIVHLLPSEPGGGSTLDSPYQAFDITVRGNDIYVVGAGDRDALYWKNDQLQVVFSSFAQAHGIALKDSDVYITGYHLSGAVVWKNGVITSLPNSSSAASIVFAGNDQYVAGGSPVNGHENGAYWKNGVQFPLYNSVYGSQPARCMAVLGNDVYIGGQVTPFNGPDDLIPAYWKNGVLTQLPYQNNGAVWDILAVLHH